MESKVLLMRKKTAAFRHSSDLHAVVPKLPVPLQTKKSWLRLRVHLLQLLKREAAVLPHALLAQVASVHLAAAVQRSPPLQAAAGHPTGVVDACKASNADDREDLADKLNNLE